MARAGRKATHWSIRQRERWVPLLGETYGRAYVEVRRQLMHGFVLLATLLVMSMIWDATLWQPAGDVLGVIATVIFTAAGVVAVGIPTFRLLQLQAKIARHLRDNGVSIRHGPDLRDSWVYLAWCRREGLEPENVARPLELPAHVEGR